MRLICPSCGAIASLEAWQNEPAWRQFSEVLTRFPAMLQGRVIHYLGLFRQGERGLAPTRAVKVLSELQEQVAAGTVRWEGGEERPCTASVWAEALDAVLARRPQGLKNHNYLRHVAWEMARGQAALAEREREEENARRAYKGPVIYGSEGDKHAVDSSEEERSEVLRQLREFSRGFGA